MSDDADRRAWEIVLRHIEGALVDGRLSPGDHLPPERTLAVDLGVGRSSVREAIRVLEVLGLVRTQVGSGPRSGAIIIARPSGGMAQLMRLQVAAQGFAVADLVKTRLVLETAIVRELADDQTVDLGASRELLQTMDAAAHEPAEFLTLDAQFHLSLALASRNVVISSIMAGLRSSIEHYVLAGASALPSWADTSARLRREHRDILEAVSAGDGDLATRLIEQHITGYHLETDSVRVDDLGRLSSRRPSA